MVLEVFNLINFKIISLRKVQMYNVLATQNIKQL